nr:aminoglycoside phosphotransferase family protein [Streptomyces typhae]
MPDPHFRELIEPHTGKVDNVLIPRRGFSSDFAAIIETAKGSFFVKAMFNHPGGRLDSIRREKEINPSVQSISPRLLWDVESEGWVILGFEAVEGRSANFDLGSTDLPVIIDALNRITEIPVPAAARDWSEERWDSFASGAEAEHFRGAVLLHTDINPSNVMIAPNRTWVVDWSWPTYGAGFIDPSLLVVQLISAGHLPAQAESWAAECPAWASAAPEAIDAFARATWRMYRQAALASPDRWLGDMADAAQSWLRYRINARRRRSTQAPISPSPSDGNPI